MLGYPSARGRIACGSLKSSMLNEDFTEVEWVGQTDQVLVIKDRCSARVAAGTS